MIVEGIKFIVVTTMKRCTHTRCEGLKITTGSRDWCIFMKASVKPMQY